MNDHHDHAGQHAPEGHLEQPGPVVPLTVDEVLAMARRVERTASICLRADLQGEWDALMAELASLVSPTGELIDQDDEALNSNSARVRVAQINDRLSELRRTMLGSMWHVRFSGMFADEWAAFKRRNRPKGEKADWTEFYNRLVAETAIAPTITIEQFKDLRRKLTESAIEKLIKTAVEASSEGGLDVPKLPFSLRNHAERYSET